MMNLLLSAHRYAYTMERVPFQDAMDQSDHTSPQPLGADSVFFLWWNNLSLTSQLADRYTMKITQEMTNMASAFQIFLLVQMDQF